MIHLIQRYVLYSDTYNSDMFYSRYLDTFQTDRLCSDRFHTDTFHTDMFCLGTHFKHKVNLKKNILFFSYAACRDNSSKLKSVVSMLFLLNSIQ
jgi:hypothetical protein